MKHFITYLLYVAFATLSAQPHSTTDWQLSNLQGKVKSVRAIPYEISNGKKGAIAQDINAAMKIANIENQLKEFNPKGFLTQTRFFHQNGDLYSRMEYYYTPEGQLFETRYNSDKTLYVYNPAGYLIKDVTYSPGGFLKNHYSYQLNDKGQVLKEETYYYNQLESSVVYTYHKKGYAAETDYYNAEDQLQQKVLTTVKGNPKTERNKTYNANGKLMNITTKKYNSAGDCISLQSENKLPEKSKNVATYTYTYDPQGNWTSKTTFINGEAREIIERTFEYYE